MTEQFITTVFKSLFRELWRKQKTVTQSQEAHIRVDEMDVQMTSYSARQRSPGDNHRLLVARYCKRTDYLDIRSLFIIGSKLCKKKLMAFYISE